MSRAGTLGSKIPRRRALGALLLRNVNIPFRFVDYIRSCFARDSTIILLPRSLDSNFFLVLV